MCYQPVENGSEDQKLVLVAGGNGKRGGEREEGGKFPREPLCLCRACVSACRRVVHCRIAMPSLPPSLYPLPLLLSHPSLLLRTFHSIHISGYAREGGRKGKAKFPLQKVQVMPRSPFQNSEKEGWLFPLPHRGGLVHRIDNDEYSRGQRCFPPIFRPQNAAFDLA